MINADLTFHVGRHGSLGEDAVLHINQQLFARFNVTDRFIIDLR
jgi:hypothetical protein